MEAVPVFLRAILVPVFGKFGGKSFHFLTHGAHVRFPMVINSSLWDCRSFEVDCNFVFHSEMITHTWSCMYILDEGVVVGKGEVKAGTGFRSCYIGLMLDESIS